MKGVGFAYKTPTHTLRAALTERLMESIEHGFNSSEYDHDATLEIQSVTSPTDDSPVGIE